MMYRNADRCTYNVYYIKKTEQSTEATPEDCLIFDRYFVSKHLTRQWKKKMFLDRNTIKNNNDYAGVEIFRP